MRQGSSVVMQQQERYRQLNHANAAAVRRRGQECVRAAGFFVAA